MDFALDDTQTELRDLARKIISDLATNERLKNHRGRGDRSSTRPSGKSSPRQTCWVWPSPSRTEEAASASSSCACCCRRSDAAWLRFRPTRALVLGALPIVAQFGTDAQTAGCCCPVRSHAARSILTAALVELDAADPHHPTTTARREATDSWVLERRQVERALGAVSRRTSWFRPRCGDGRVALFVVDATTRRPLVQRRSATAEQPAAATPRSRLDRRRRSRVRVPSSASSTRAPSSSTG